MSKFDVLIVGAGYAGLMCALRLAARVKGRSVKIGVVNPSASFVERQCLHEGLADGVSQLRPLDLQHALRKAGITLIVGRVVSLDRTARHVGVETAGAVRNVGYGRLVIAAGSHNRRDQIPGAGSVAYSLDANHPRSAAALRDALSAKGHPRVLVIGGGATEMNADTSMPLEAKKLRKTDRGRLFRLSRRPHKKGVASRRNPVEV